MGPSEQQQILLSQTPRFLHPLRQQFPARPSSKKQTCSLWLPQNPAPAMSPRRTWSKSLSDSAANVPTCCTPKKTPIPTACNSPVEPANTPKKQPHPACSETSSTTQSVKLLV